MFDAFIFQVKWPGRCQVIRAGSEGLPANKLPPNVALFVDGAHTRESVVACAEWFADESAKLNAAASSKSQVVNFLLFNCGHERNPFELLEPLIRLGFASAHPVQFQRVLFCPFDHDRTSLSEPPSADKLARIWKRGWHPALSARAATDDGDLKANGVAAAKPCAWQHTLATVWDSVSLDLLESEPAKGGGEFAATTLSSLHQHYPHQLTVHASAAEALQSILQEVGAALEDAAESVPKTARVLVNGSLYLVGNVFAALDFRL